MSSKFTPANTLDFEKQHPLLNVSWPVVSSVLYGGFDFFREFISLPKTEQHSHLVSLRGQEDAHGKFLQSCLSKIYAYWFGYADSATYLQADDDLETAIHTSKILLEREMLEYWLTPTRPPEGLNQVAAVEYLRELIKNNAGVFHGYFDFIRDEMSRESMLQFLKFETIRNEVVDDEVALIIVGLQGQMKNVMASNLWDECGNGNVEGFHTHWLRRLLSQLGTVEDFLSFRDTKSPWFTSITSNSFNMMATRPGYKYRAYGSFLITESWVAPHFERILEGMKRTGCDHDDLTVYFSKHFTIDPHHTDQMFTAMQNQQPVMTVDEVQEVLWGAHTAIAAGVRLYDLSLQYFQK